MPSEAQLRSKLIRLARRKPELRRHILPLLTASRSKRAAGTFLRKMPDNTQANGYDTWGSWDGNLAMVEGPWGTSITPADFDVNRMARHYSVLFALDTQRRGKIPADRTNLGYSIVVRDRSANYENTTWSIKNSFGRAYRVGTFSKHYDFWVQVKPKELSKREVYAVIEKLDRESWYDATGQPNKLAKRQWQALLKGSFADAQEQNPEMANAADRAVTWANNGYTKSLAQDERIWKSIQGVYKLNKARTKLMWMIPRR